MKLFTYSQARQNLATVLSTAEREEVLIRRRGGQVFSVTLKQGATSPFDVPGVKTGASTSDILAAVRTVRSRRSRGRRPDGPSARPSAD